MIIINKAKNDPKMRSQLIFRILFMQAAAIGIVNNFFIFLYFINYIGLLLIVLNRRIVIYVRSKIYGTFTRLGNIEFRSFISATSNVKNTAGLETIDDDHIKY